jgi:uncharacterized membrane protein YgdD (TMEM256/DUF423 family)
MPFTKIIVAGETAGRFSTWIPGGGPSAMRPRDSPSRESEIDDVNTEEGMDRLFAVLGSLSALLAVGLGAFAAHGLKSRLSTDMIGAFEVGVRYQMYHALALLAAAWASGRWPGAPVIVAGWLFVGGTIMFSGSLYLLSVSGQRWLGAITPIGGFAFLLGWLALAWAAWNGP